MPTPETLPKAKKPRKLDLARYCDLRERKKKLESEARSLETEINQLSDLTMSWLEEIGKNAATIHGYRVTIEEGRAYVSWKDEFVRLAGADNAASIAAAAPRPPRLSVLAPV